MNIELIEKQIRELDINNIIPYIEKYNSNGLNFGNIFLLKYFHSTDTIEYNVIYDDIGEQIEFDFLYDINNGFNKVIGIATFLRENEDKIKQIIKDNL